MFATIIEQATTLRRALHRRPELTWQEAETAATIRAQLDALGIAWRTCARHGTIATLAPDAPGPCVALRADIDALPITEADDLPDRSEHDGRMHACGHDGHTAALWATAAWLRQCERDLPGPVRLLFQPAEEGGHGAREMIADGALDGVERIFGWHNWPGLPTGQVLCPDGPIMSGNGSFEITLRGVGGHSSQPEQCRDPVLAAAAVTLALQQIVARRLPPQVAAVVSVTSIEAPSAVTVVPDEARLAGSIRFAEPHLRETINAALAEIAGEVARGYGVAAEVAVHPRYGPTINHAGPAALYRAALAAEFGPACQAAAALPVMGSEDFSYYLDAVPGAFALIGAGSDPAYQVGLHNPRYRFNDAILGPVVRVLARLAGLSEERVSG